MVQDILHSATGVTRPTPGQTNVFLFLACKEICIHGFCKKVGFRQTALPSRKGVAGATVMDSELLSYSTGRRAAAVCWLEPLLSGQADSRLRRSIYANEASTVEGGNGERVIAARTAPRHDMRGSVVSGARVGCRPSSPVC